MPRFAYEGEVLFSTPGFPFNPHRHFDINIYLRLSQIRAAMPPKRPANPSASSSSSQPSQRPRLSPHPVAERLRRAVPADAVWSQEDQVNLHDTGKPEIAVWRRAIEIFDQPPGDLLPAGEFVDTSDNGKTLSLPDREVPNVNWAPKFCWSLLTVILCPIFAGRPQYLRDVIQFAMWHRLRATTNRPRPQFTWPRDDNLQFPAHEEFLEKLGPVVEGMKFTKVSQGILLRDLKSIIDAWDEYAVENGLKSMDQYRRQFRNGQGRPGVTVTVLDEEEIISMKKDWILANRHRAAPRHESQ